MAVFFLPIQWHNSKQCIDDNASEALTGTSLEA